MRSIWYINDNMNEFYKQRAMIAGKVQESITSVLPILCIVCLLCLFVTPLPTGHMLSLKAP